MSGEPVWHRARGLGEIAARIPEITLPHRPRLIEDLLSLPVEGGRFLLGGEPSFIGGASLERVFEQLLDGLDGRRTIRQIITDTPGLPATRVRDILTLALMHGLLEDEAMAVALSPEVQALPDHAAQPAFYSRYLRQSGRRPHRSGAMRSLGEASVTLFAPRDDQRVKMVEHGLLAQGVRSVRLARTGAPCGAQERVRLLKRCRALVERLDVQERPLATLWVERLG